MPSRPVQRGAERWQIGYSCEACWPGIKRAGGGVSRCKWSTSRTKLTYRRTFGLAPSSYPILLLFAVAMHESMTKVVAAPTEQAGKHSCCRGGALETGREEHG